MVATRTARATSIVSIFVRRTILIMGLYTHIMNLVIGFFLSGMMRPRIKNPINTGTRVMDKSADAAMANVLVNARGLKSLPSWASRVKTGINETVMIRREKNSGGPTSLLASMTTRHLSDSGLSSIFLCTFSIITIAPSIMAPMAIAMPPRLMMFALILRYLMTINEMRMATGSMRMATRALLKWRRKIMQTSETMTDSSISFPFRVSMAR